MLYALKLYSTVCKLHIIKTRRKKEKRWKVEVVSKKDALSPSKVETPRHRGELIEPQKLFESVSSDLDPPSWVKLSMEATLTEKLQKLT